MTNFWDDFQKNLTLTEDDRGAIRDLVNSKGWHILTHKVYPKTEHDLMMQKNTSFRDPGKASHHAGQLAGLQQAQTLPERIARGPRKRQRPTDQTTIHLDREIARGSKPL